MDITTVEPRAVAEELETRASLPEARDWERLRGYAVAGIPFDSGHVLAMRRFPLSSIGPGYTSVWHRDPAGRWVIYQDRGPEYSCPRAFGPVIDAAPTVPIRVRWTGERRFTVDIDADEVSLHWEIPLFENLPTRALNAAAAALPRSVLHHPLALAVIGRIAGPLLGVGRVRLAGTVPSRQSFYADLRRIMLIENSRAVLNGEDLGPHGRAPEQNHLGDFWLPRRGLFAVADSYFEPYDPDRHDKVASRQELKSPVRRAAALPDISLYGLPASHPSAAVERALDLKGLPFRRRDRLPVLHRVQHRLIFGQGSAPAMRIGSRRLVGTMEILAALDTLAPHPPMFPSDEGRAASVVEAAKWADADFQALARRLAWAGMVECPRSVRSVLEGANLPVPNLVAYATSRPIILLGARLNGATKQQVRDDLAALPAMLDRADEMLAQGVLGDGDPNAAGLQVAATVALLERLEDVRPQLTGRPVAELARAHFPDYPGRIPTPCVVRAGSLSPG